MEIYYDGILRTRDDFIYEIATGAYYDFFEDSRRDDEIEAIIDYIYPNQITSDRLNDCFQKVIETNQFITINGFIDEFDR